MYKICSDYAYSYSTEAVNKAVIDSLKNSIKYTDLIVVEKNVDGEIVLMTADSLKINNISREISVSSSNILKDKLTSGIPIPALAFSGIEILSGYGKIVNLKTVHVISVTCDFSSNFKSVGINQTLHSIYVDVCVNVNIEVPLNNQNESYSTKVLIGESVLVGEVPQIYLNGKLFG